MDRILNLYPSNVIRWQLRPPFFMDVRKIFNQSDEEDKELIDFYGKGLNFNMTLIEKAEIIAKRVNLRLRYQSDKITYRNVEYWARPIDAHDKKIDDCEGYAVLICYLLRLFGAAPWEVFVRTGDAVHPNGKIEGHANVVIFDIMTRKFYYLEGSFYPDIAFSRLGKIEAKDNSMYKNTWFVTNDLVSYSTVPWIKLVR